MSYYNLFSSSSSSSQELSCPPHGDAMMSEREIYESLGIEKPFPVEDDKESQIMHGLGVDKPGTMHSKQTRHAMQPAAATSLTNQQNIGQVGQTSALPMTNPPQTHQSIPLPPPNTGHGDLASAPPDRFQLGQQGLATTNQPQPNTGHRGQANFPPVETSQQSQQELTTSNQPVQRHISQMGTQHQQVPQPTHGQIPQNTGQGDRFSTSPPNTLESNIDREGLDDMDYHMSANVENGNNYTIKNDYKNTLHKKQPLYSGRAVSMKVDNHFPLWGQEIILELVFSYIKMHVALY